MVELNGDLRYGMSKFFGDWINEKPELGCDICNKLLSRCQEIHFVSINNVKFYLFCSEDCLNEWLEQHMK